MCHACFAPGDAVRIPLLMLPFTTSVTFCARNSLRLGPFGKALSIFWGENLQFN